jgi:antitoxin component of MazEF toxin-antitoxin module
MSDKLNITFRKTFSIGGSLGITLPDMFCKGNNLQESETVVVEYDKEKCVVLTMRQYQFAEQERNERINKKVK